MNVLYIEDNSDDVIMISDMLSQDKGIAFNVKSAPSLYDGIEALTNSPFDVVLLDLGLPDNFGLAAVTKITHLKKEIPIIVLTGTSDRALGVKAVEMGAQDYLIKEQLDENLIAMSIQYTVVRYDLTLKLNQQEAELRQKAEDQLDEISNRLLLATRGANIGIWEHVIATGELIWDDRMCELYGITSDRFSGDYEHWESRVHAKDKPYVLQQIALALNGEKEYNTAYRVVWSDESVHYIKAAGIVKRDSGGKAVKMIGANWDVTNEKMAELGRAQAEEAKRKDIEQFTYIASHDLQEPLRTVQGLTDFLIRDYGQRIDADGHYALNSISESTKRMSNLIKGLLTYSKIGKSGEITTINFNQILEELCRDLSTVIEERKAVIEVIDMPLSLEGYELELRQLFLNLITNATKFIRADATPIIRISSKEYKQNWQFTVEDNGIGIKSQYGEKVFEIFQRLHTKQEFGGTGIGLAYCKKIVELHEGKIWVESVVNQGSTFHFTISKHIGQNKLSYYEQKT